MLFHFAFFNIMTFTKMMRAHYFFKNQATLDNIYLILSRSRVILNQRACGHWISFIHSLLLHMQALPRVVPMSTTSQTQNHMSPSLAI